MSIRILVVDDAAFIRDMMKKHLREQIENIQLFDAVDGQRALTVMKSNPIDLILSDWEMPGMSGEEFLRWVRSQEEYKTLPFVMVTSRGDRNHVIQAIQAGVSDYLTKPFTPDELIRKVLKQLTKTGQNPVLKSAGRGGSLQSHTSGSVDVLTGGKSSSAAKARPTPKDPPAAKVRAKAQLRFAKVSFHCQLKELSLQQMRGSIPREEWIPGLFDQVAIDLADDEGDNLARLNGYVHELQAGENRLNTDIIKIAVRFVDEDPEKMDLLSKYISSHQV